MVRIGLFIVFMWMSSLSTSAQNAVFSTKNGETSFNSNALLENIEATNKNVISFFNINNREITVRMLIDQFQFRNKLMQQHFNEYFMDSDKYPNASFKGKIKEVIDFSKPGIYPISAIGVLNIHGVERKRTLHGELIVSEDGFTLATQFNVLLTDFKISIPKLVLDKIAESILVTTSLNFLPYSKNKPI